jgi:hypothetical protein
MSTQASSSRAPTDAPEASVGHPLVERRWALEALANLLEPLDQLEVPLSDGPRQRKVRPAGQPLIDAAQTVIDYLNANGLPRPS